MSTRVAATRERTPLRVALLGCGTVGFQVARLLHERAADLRERTGAPLELVGIAVRDLDRERPGVPVDHALFTTDADDLVTRADIVIELIGGIEPARTLLLAAMKSGASVVTGNKVLLAADGPTLYDAAAEYHVDIYAEAAVAGGIPLLRPLRESLAGDEVRRVLGIVNGTTNFVLDQMERTGVDVREAIAAAQRLGYAEADPSADVEGQDAAAKAAIIASTAFHTRVAQSDVHCEGIGAVSTADIAAAAQMDCVVKLLAICERTAGGVNVRVHPAMVPRSHPLAAVRGAFNAVFVEAVSAQQLMFYGPGAGGDATASAVLGDVVAVAWHRVYGGRAPGESSYADLAIDPFGASFTRYHIDLAVADQPGVLERVAGVFARHDISIEMVRQRPLTGAAVPTASYPAGSAGSTGTSGMQAGLVVMTHPAREAALADTVAALADLDSVHGVTSVMRVEGA